MACLFIPAHRGSHGALFFAVQCIVGCWGLGLLAGNSTPTPPHPEFTETGPEIDKALQEPHPTPPRHPTPPHPTPPPAQPTPAHPSQPPDPPPHPTPPHPTPPHNIRNSGASARRFEAVRSPSIPHQVGSPMYMAPEWWDGRGGTAASDMWSVGVVLYELLALTPPYDQRATATKTCNLHQAHSARDSPVALVA